jgi:ribonucleoside-diphosphate reductase alpha chain
MGHLEMMAAVQPFLSGAISKTVNVPQNTSIEVIEELYIQGWILGLKAIAIYRDNCKVAQPLSGTSTADVESTDDIIWRELALEAEGITTALSLRVRELEAMLDNPVRERLPRQRRSRTYAFEVGGAEGYATVGEYDDRRPGEIFVKISKQGSTIAGIMDAFSIAVSLGLQHGVPLESFVRKFTNMRFEPAGITDDAELRIASSLVDYLFRRIALDYMDADSRAEHGIHSTAERAVHTAIDAQSRETTQETSAGGLAVLTKALDQEPLDATQRPALGSTAQVGSETALNPSSQRHADSPMCYTCGTSMLRTGNCYACPSCGQTSGCS